MTTRTAAVVLTLMATIGLAGCGGDDKPKSASDADFDFSQRLWDGLDQSVRDNMCAAVKTDEDSVRDQLISTGKITPDRVDALIVIAVVECP